jgi:hypothetical protein
MPNCSTIAAEACALSLWVLLYNDNSLRTQFIKVGQQHIAWLIERLSKQPGLCSNTAHNLSIILKSE